MNRSVKNKLIKIAYENPELRADLLPVIQKSMTKKAEEGQSVNNPEVEAELTKVLEKVLTGMGLPAGVHADDPKLIEKLEALQKGAKTASHDWRLQEKVRFYKEQLKGSTQLGFGAGALVTTALMHLAQRGVELPWNDISVTDGQALLIALAPMILGAVGGYGLGKATLKNPTAK